MKKLILAFCISSSMWQLYAQANDNGSINLHFGTLIIYNTYSVGYETKNLIKSNKKHQIRPVVRIGGWKSSFFEKNTGGLVSLGSTYLYGKSNHYFEFSSELVFHFDKGLKDQSIVSTGVLYRPFIGYRFLPNSKRLTAKIGLGWYEFIQFGLGFKL